MISWQLMNFRQNASRGGILGATRATRTQAQEGRGGGGVSQPWTPRPEMLIPGLHW